MKEERIKMATSIQAIAHLSRRQEIGCRGAVRRIGGTVFASF